MEEDKLTPMLLDMLIETYAQEPPYPDPDKHDRAQVNLMARKYDEWDGKVTGLGHLIGARLLQAELKKRKL